MNTTPPFPFEAKFQTYLQQLSGTEIEPTGYDASLYQDIAEKIVRTAANWVDETGRVLDPVTGEEWAQTTPRFASAVAPLIKAGRCVDLLDICVRCLDRSTQDIVSGAGRAHDFWPRDLVLAIDCISNRVPVKKVETWKKRLNDYDPQDRYSVVTSKLAPEKMHNFAIYSLTGEQMKHTLGVGNSLEFVEAHLETQVNRFTSLGMYRDPFCPMTYDLTVRQNLVLLMLYQYSGAHLPEVSEWLRRGALTQLFFQSTTGEMPFGGRSNQFHILEGMFCCISEYVAKQYAKSGEMALAGSFKRAARKAAAATTRWVLDAEPFRHIKNMFPPAKLHGCDHYGLVSSYGLLAANLFALTGLIADDSIPERAAPIDVGGYVLPILDDFHRIWATCGDYHIQIDTAGQPQYDATGLARFHHRDFPSEAGLSMGFTRDPRYTVVEPAANACFAIGPAWMENGEFVSLANLQPQPPELKIIREDSTVVQFQLTYSMSETVQEVYELTAHGLSYHVSVAEGPIRVTLPVILTDGSAKSEIHLDGNLVVVKYRGVQYIVKAVNAETTAQRKKQRLPNRNGIYDLIVFENLKGNLNLKLHFI